MIINNIKTLNILGVNVSNLTDENFLECIKTSIVNNRNLRIGYANADTLNKSYEDANLRNIINSFDLVHPDGTGVYLASRFLYQNGGLEKRLTGSDFYSILIKESIRYDWSFFFFGHTIDTLNEIKRLHPELNIAGLHGGYEISNSEVINKINEANPDIIIIGLSCPVQEKWVFENSHLIKHKVILCTGDGIKVFAGKKIRGPVFMRKIGLEWFIRYLTNPVSNFKRYIIGVPVFIFRVFKEKLKTN